MGQCDICSREGDYNAVDSEGLLRDIGDSELTHQIRQLRNDNREYLAQYKFVPMADKSFFRGRLSDLSREGYGEMYAEHFNYYGHFRNDLPHGTGAMLTDSHCFYGQFSEGRLEGTGKEWSREFSFEGDYVAGERVRGTLNKEELTYSGGFASGLFHGRGKLNFKDGRSYEGHFHQGLFHGQGKLWFPTGNTYEGGFRQGKFHGYGHFQWANGNSYRG